jgi:transposase
MSSEYLNNKTFEAIIATFQNYKKQKQRSEMLLNDWKETHERRLIKYQDNNKYEIFNKTTEQHKEICASFIAHQEQLAYAFYILSENIASYARFQGIDVDDAIQEGVLICFEKN